jgi:hypothetical protein
MYFGVNYITRVTACWVMKCLHLLPFRKRQSSPENRRAVKAQRGVEIRLTSPLDAGVWSAPCLGRFSLGNGPVAIVQEAGWAQL